MKLNPDERKIWKNIKHDAFLRWVFRRVHQHNGSINILVVGDTGSGKSWFSLSLAHNLDPKFNGMPNTSLLEFMESLINEPYKGKVNFFEEVGITENLQARNFQSEQNKLGSSGFQILRFVNGINLLTVPKGSFVDKQVRELMNVVIEVTGHDDKFGYGVVKYIVSDHWSGKTMTPYPRYMSPEGEWYVMDFIAKYKPPKYITDNYENFMNNRKTQWLKKFITQLKNREKKKKGEENIALKEAEALIMANKDEFLYKRGNKFFFSPDAVAYFFETNELSFSSSSIRRIVSAMNQRIRIGKMKVEPRNVSK